MPAYNAEKTLQKTYSEIDFNFVDEVILCDDNSTDNTINIAKDIGIQHVIKHDINKGYGGNQKTLYNYALNIGADIVIMVHPDYQYTPLLIPAIVSIIGNRLYPVVLASRILGKGALKGGMPTYKYVANRILTLIQNILFNQKISEYHTGYRAFTSEVLKSINYNANSDDFVFDNEMLAQIIYQNYEIGEVTCPTKYFEEASSINFLRSSKYGLECIGVSFRFLLHKMKLRKDKIF